MPKLKRTYHVHERYRPYKDKQKKRSRYLPPLLNTAAFIKGEVKHIDITVSNVTTANSLAATHLTNIAQGALRNNRIGNRIHVLGVDIKGRMAEPRSTAWFLCTPRGGVSTPSYTDFSGGVFAIPEVIKVFSSSIGGIGGIKNTDSYMTNYHFRFKYPLEVIYNGSAGTDVTDNKLFYTQNNYTSSNISAADLVARVYYQDL